MLLFSQSSSWIGKARATSNRVQVVVRRSGSKCGSPYCLSDLHVCIPCGIQVPHFFQHKAKYRLSRLGSQGTFVPCYALGHFSKQGGWQFNEDYYYYCCCNLLNPTVSFKPFSPSGSRQGGSSMREVVWHVCLDIEETHLERCTMSDNKGLARWVISKWTRSGTGRQSDQRSGEDESFPLDIEHLESHESSRAEQYQLPNPCWWSAGRWAATTADQLDQATSSIRLHATSSKDFCPLGTRWRWH